MEKIVYLNNGQWSLSKAEDYSHIYSPHIENNIPTGSHTIEVHPHIDHLYNIKGHIADSGKDHITVGELKKKGVDKNFIRDHVPKDGKGKITSDMIDKHIDGLPKHKVNINIAPYDMGAQQHRPGQQHVASVSLHPDTLEGMCETHKELWLGEKDTQHRFNGIDSKHQVGWGRIDPKGQHWHIDEIQSDFSNTKGLNDNSPPHSRAEAIAAFNFMKDNPDHPMTKKYWNSEIETWAIYGMCELMNGTDEEGGIRHKFSQLTGVPMKPERDKTKDEANKKGLLSTLSHGHDDPQHMVHSALNQLARKHGIKSISMDTPLDQAEQSGLRIKGAGIQGVANKMGKDSFSRLLHFAHSSDPDDGAIDRDELVDCFAEGHDLTPRENKVLRGFMGDQLVHGHAHDMYDPEVHKESREEFVDQIVEREVKRVFDESSNEEPPVHQMNTYKKRPKKLGMTLHDKNDVMGSHPEDEQTQVQYHKLHKKLRLIQEQLQKIKRS